MLTLRLERAQGALQRVAREGLVSLPMKELAPLLGVRSARAAQRVVRDLVLAGALTSEVAGTGRGNASTFRLAESTTKHDRKARLKHDQSTTGEGVGGGAVHGLLPVQTKETLLLQPAPSAESTTKARPRQALLVELRRIANALERAGVSLAKKDAPHVRLTAATPPPHPEPFDRDVKPENLLEDESLILERVEQLRETGKLRSEVGLRQQMKRDGDLADPEKRAALTRARDDRARGRREQEELASKPPARDLTESEKAEIAAERHKSYLAGRVT